MNTLSSALNARMDFLIARQGVVAGNIANADTPNYVARDMVQNRSSFAGMAMAATHGRHLSAAAGTQTAGRMVEDRRFIQHNGNSVRLDQEMLKLQDTQLNYRLMTQLYAKNIQLQQLALGRGR
jgi:flagellar basal-body rod protein FlgB